MAEERREPQVMLAVERAPPVAAHVLGPGRGSHRMGGRAQRQDVEHDRLVQAAPIIRQMPAFGIPAERDGGRAHLEPVPVGAAIEGVSQGSDLALGRVRVIEVGLAEERPGEQQRGVHARKLDPLEARAGRRIEEVVEEPAVAGGTPGRGVLARGPEEAQRVAHARRRLLAGHVAALGADRVGGEREARRPDARERARRPAVRREAGGGIAQLPEEAERPLLEGVEERRLRAREPLRRQRGPSARLERAGGPAPDRRRFPARRGRHGGWAGRRRDRPNDPAEGKDQRQETGLGGGAQPPHPSSTSR